MKKIFLLCFLISLFIGCVQIKCKGFEAKNFDEKSFNLKSDSIFNNEFLSKFNAKRVLNFVNGEYVAFLQKDEVFILNFPINIKSRNFSLKNAVLKKANNIITATNTSYVGVEYLGDKIDISCEKPTNGNLYIETTTGSIKFLKQSDEYLIFSGHIGSMRIGFLENREYLFNASQDAISYNNRKHDVIGVMIKKEKQLYVYIFYSLEEKMLIIKDLFHDDYLKENNNSHLLN